MVESAGSNSLGVLDILEPSSEPGPKQGLGGWGMPSANALVGPDSLGLILGYCLEKVTNQFAFLRSLTLKNAELQKSLHQLSVSRPGSQVTMKNPNRKKAEAAFAEANEGLAQGSTDGLNALVIDEDLLGALEADEKKQLLSTVLNHEKSSELAFQQAAMFVLRNAEGPREFSALLDSIGGTDAILSRVRGVHRGALYCLLEHFGASEWAPPFHHGIFTGEVDGDAVEGGDPLAAIRGQMIPDSDPLIQADYMDRFVQGDLTASDMMGLTREELYMIAQRGYELIQEGKLEQAREVFDGLVYLDPYDPYFYTVLGSICQKQESFEKAVQCYDVGIRLQAWNVNALANRGEILLNQGKLTEALTDLQAVITYEPDPENTNPSVVRTKALLYTIKEIVDQKTQEGGA